MNPFHLFNRLYERLSDLKEDSWPETKAAISPFMVIFSLALIVLFFAVVYLIRLFRMP